MNVLRFAALAFAMGLAAGCGAKDGDEEHRADGTAQQALPAPQAGTGSITGMPDRPGPAAQGPASPAPNAGADIVFEVPPDPADNPETGLPTGEEAAAAADAAAMEPGDREASQQDAVAVIRDYYAAINAQDHDRAHRLWADEGRSSGQSPAQFAGGFADVAGISVELASPGLVRASAREQSITVPVAVTTSRRDGSVRRYDGTYTLRRSLDPAATPGQRAWRIGSADLRELQ